MENKKLIHAGIKGMKWGVRRFQYEDGTLTPAGKKRYGSKEALEAEVVKNYGSIQTMKNQQHRNLDNLERTSKVLGDSSRVLKDAANINTNQFKSKTVNNKDYSNISDAELRNRINRITMERTYGELTGDTKRVRSGGDWTREVLQTTGAVVGIASSAAAIAYTIVSIKGAKGGKGGGKN